MKIIIVTFIFVLLLVYNCYSILPADSTAKSCPSREGGRNLKPPADGLTLLMGIYNPLHSEMKNIYGSGFIISVQHCLNMSHSMDLLTSMGFMTKNGNPYYDDPTFSSGEASKIDIIPIEVSIRHRIALMKTQSGLASRGLYIGAGINYVRASEKVTDLVLAKGGDFGIQIFAGPQIFLREDVAFEGEAKLLANEVDMKSSDARYSVTLSGLVVRVGLSWYY